MTLDDAKGEIAWHLDEIRTLFKPGVKLTILCRRDTVEPGDQDLLMTDDDADEVLAAVKRLAAGLDARKGGG